jgi:hypothetical protein
VVTRPRSEELQRRSSWGVRLEDGSPTSDLPCKTHLTCSGELQFLETRKEFTGRMKCHNGSCRIGTSHDNPSNGRGRCFIAYLYFKSIHCYCRQQQDLHLCKVIIIIIIIIIIRNTSEPFYYLPFSQKMETLLPLLFPFHEIMPSSLSTSWKCNLWKMSICLTNHFFNIKVLGSRVNR